MTQSQTIAKLLLLVAITALIVCATVSAWAAPAKKLSFTGVWKGTSVCQIKDSPCHDEGAVYTVKKLAASESFEFSGNKVVDGKETFMGTLECELGSERDSLVCGQGDAAVWTWKLQGDSMSGTLVLRGQLFRKISLTRAK